MPLMNVFEPLFLLLALLTLVTLLRAAVLAVTGRFERAGRILRRLAIGGAVYFAVVVAVSFSGPRRIYGRGEAQCFDDWCITVTGGGWADGTPAARYEVSLLLSSRAKRVPMGEKGTVVYLVDGNGRRYDPVPGSADVPLDTLLPPGGSVVATRWFDVPRGTPGLGLVYAREGGFPIEWLIVGEGGWFQQPPLVRLEQ